MKSPHLILTAFLVICISQNIPIEAYTGLGIAKIKDFVKYCTETVAFRYGNSWHRRIRRSRRPANSVSILFLTLSFKVAFPSNKSGNAIADYFA